MKLSALVENFDREGGPNRYFHVTKDMDVFQGKSGAPGTFPSFHKVSLKPGDEIHWLKGGMFAIRDGKVLIDSVHLENPDDDTEAQHHSRRNDSDGYTIHQFKKLLGKSLEDMEKEDASKPSSYR